ncbi:MULTISPECIES: hypothetical protein [Anoxybacillaceae]|uniref:Lipoprotein n=2 Tax=Anoxybacillaceae TaxID=3120669 RepID=A0A150MJB6_9BACL|nr:MULTISPECIES: hypothetical protein [Bacillaceae]KYD24634.1 hypothetical protein B4110_0643 [Parageobacillus toebii]
MRKTLLITLIAVVSALFSGCGNNEKASAPEKDSKQIDQVQGVDQQKSDGKEAFENYLNSITPILQEIGTWGQKYEDLRTKSANGQISNEEFAAAISNELLPEGNKLQEKMESIMPEEKEFRDVQEKLNQMMAKNNQAFSEIIAAINAGDASKITSANNLLSEARELERQAYYDLKDLSDKYGVPFMNQ